MLGLAHVSTAAFQEQSCRFCSDSDELEMESRSEKDEFFFFPSTLENKIGE